MAIVFTLAGCRDRDLEALQSVRAEVCRCKDAACVDAALARMPKAGPKRRIAAQRVAQEILTCVAAVGEGEPPPKPSEQPLDPQVPGEAPPAEAVTP